MGELTVFKKYELTSESITVGSPLYRIKALRSFGDVKCGDLGGFVASEKNLSHAGNCWVYNEARVYEEARVFQDARLSGNARLYGNAFVSGDAHICGNVEVCGCIWIGDGGEVCGDTYLYGKYSMYLGRLKLDHGIWTRDIEMHNRTYLLSSTLEMILVKYNV